MAQQRMMVKPALQECRPLHRSHNRCKIGRTKRIYHWKSLKMRLRTFFTILVSYGLFHDGAVVRGDPLL